MEAGPAAAKIEAFRSQASPALAWANRLLERYFVRLRRHSPGNWSGALHGEQRSPASRHAGPAYSTTPATAKLLARYTDLLQSHSARETTGVPGQRRVAHVPSAERAAEEELWSGLLFPPGAPTRRLWGSPGGYATVGPHQKSVGRATLLALPEASVHPSQRSFRLCRPAQGGSPAPRWPPGSLLFRSAAFFPSLCCVPGRAASFGQLCRWEFLAGSPISRIEKEP